MAERREEEEGEEGARLWGSGGLYRPKSSWVRNGMTGGGRFGPGRVDGERAEEAAARRMAGGVVAARGAAWDACGRGRAPRGGPGGMESFPRVHFAAGAWWTKSTGGVRSPPAAYGRRRPKQSKPGERDGDRGSFAISENSRDLSVI